jgi:hypothetical protein
MINILSKKSRDTVPLKAFKKICPRPFFMLERSKYPILDSGPLRIWILDPTHNTFLCTFFMHKTGQICFY